MATSTTPLDDILELAALLKPAWAQISDEIPYWHPRCEGVDDDADATGEDTDADAATDDDGGTDDDKDTGAADQQNDPGYLKAQSRKHERRAKAERKAREEAERKLREREDADKTEQQKAIDKAREEATAEVTTKYEKQQRADRIENAVTKLSLKGFKAKDADGKEIVLRFADPDDAQLRLDRALRNEDLTYDDIYADGKVQSPAIVEFLTELLEEHPRLRAQDRATTGAAGGKDVDFDGGKGGGSGDKDPDSMSHDDHLKAVQRR